jgi:calcineurin-like phosphoesterase family protein
VSDLHGNWHDWQAFLRRSRAWERLEQGEDLWVILTGDVPDVLRHQSIDTRVPSDGDVQILDDLLAAKERLGERGERIVYAEGNHDFHVARVSLEAANSEALRQGLDPPTSHSYPVVGIEAYQRFVERYRESFGDAVLTNNVLPYDMVPRARPEHLRLITTGPVVVVLEGPRVAVVHAGPVSGAGGFEPSALRGAVEGAHASQLRNVGPEDYFASPYHQLLNNRFRHGDYALTDVGDFAALYDCGALVSGHTPHPYLLDLEQNKALPDCAYTHGVGLIGERQLVLCTSFGAFHPELKRYLELDLTKAYPDARALATDPEAVRPLYTPEESHELEAFCRPLPGASLAASLCPIGD